MFLSMFLSMSLVETPVYETLRLLNTITTTTSMNNSTIDTTSTTISSTILDVLHHCHMMIDTVKLYTLIRVPTLAKIETQQVPCG